MKSTIILTFLQSFIITTDITAYYWLVKVSSSRSRRTHFKFRLQVALLTEGFYASFPSVPPDEFLKGKPKQDE